MACRIIYGVVAMACRNIYCQPQSQSQSLFSRIWIWYLGLGFGSWIWYLDLGLGFGIGLGLDKNSIVDTKKLCRILDRQTPEPEAANWI